MTDYRDVEGLRYKLYGPIPAPNRVSAEKARQYMTDRRFIREHHEAVTSYHDQRSALVDEMNALAEQNSRRFSQTRYAKIERLRKQLDTLDLPDIVAISHWYSAACERVQQFRQDAYACWWRADRWRRRYWADNWALSYGVSIAREAEG